jgi:hypothetical protein
MADYLPSDYDPPLSDDAVILLKFVQEKKRVIAGLRSERSAIALSAFFAGILVGLHVALLFH